MPRKKIPEASQLKHLLRVRVDSATYQRLVQLQKQSDCRNLCALVRQLITGEGLTIFHKDISLSAPLEELALIRKELKAIGVNINQQTHYFHAGKNDTAKAWYVQTTGKLYERVEVKVDELLNLTEKLALKWLHGS